MKEHKYVKLTKKIVENGTEVSVCRFINTAECQLHIGCEDCPKFHAIVAQLNAFEEVYTGKD